MIRPGDLDPDRGRRIALIYLVVASTWIVVSGLVADWLAAQMSLSGVALEVGKGLLFVVVTSAILYQSLGRWTDRLQHAARAELRSAERLRRAEEMRTNFLTGVSHELRTPLAAIVGYAETINARGADLTHEQRAQLAQRLSVNADRLNDMVGDLLEVDRLLQGLGTLHVVELDVVEVVRRTVSVADLGGRRVQVVGGQVMAYVDAPKIERMIEQLLANVVRHTSDGVNTTIRLEADAATVSIVVEDDGVGLADDLLGTVFDPFVQDPSVASQASPGLGIGLTLVAQLARLHGGTVEADNRTEGGARFTIRLPRAVTVD